MGMWTHLERQEGAIGTRGPGETQLETDRRHIRRKISEAGGGAGAGAPGAGHPARAAGMKNEVPVVAIVGYTNAGKSTLLNRLTGAAIPANDRLFDTLDTTTRHAGDLRHLHRARLATPWASSASCPTIWWRPSRPPWRSWSYADLLLHVIDASNPEWRDQAAVVEDADRGAGGRADPPHRCVQQMRPIYRRHPSPRGGHRVHLGQDRPGAGRAAGRQSAGGWTHGARRVVLHLPYDQGGLLDKLYQQAKVESVEYGETIDVAAVCTPKVIGQLGPLVEGWRPHREPWED